MAEMTLKRAVSEALARLDAMSDEELCRTLEDTPLGDVGAAVIGQRPPPGDDRVRGRDGVSFDPEANAGYFRVREGRVERTYQVAPGVNVDVDETGNVLGLEVLDCCADTMAAMIDGRQASRDSASGH